MLVDLRSIRVDRSDDEAKSSNSANAEIEAFYIMEQFEDVFHITILDEMLKFDKSCF